MNNNTPVHTQFVGDHKVEFLKVNGTLQLIAIDGVPYLFHGVTGNLFDSTTGECLNMHSDEILSPERAFDDVREVPGQLNGVPMTRFVTYVNRSNSARWIIEADGVRYTYNPLLDLVFDESLNLVGNSNDLITGVLAGIHGFEFN